MGDLKGKKVVVVGTGNSGHDIAQDFCGSGADIIMLQRRGTYIISVAKGIPIFHKGMYDEGGPPTDEVDIAAHSLPIPVQFALHIGLTRNVAQVENETLKGLQKAGFDVDLGSDFSTGIWRRYMTRGGGYYINVGYSQLIIDGKIKVVRSPRGIASFSEKSIEYANGKSLPADIVVLATGFENMGTSVRNILGDAVADRCKDVWDLDEEGELNAIWRNSGHLRFWYMGGNLALCRIYSRLLAMQIKAVEEGSM